MSRDVRPTDVFAVNEEFSSKFMRIRIGVVATNRAETEQERRDTDEKTERYRGATIEAALVRIMKQRKLISHAELVNEVLTQMGSRFNPDLAMVKKRIESLMEREYMERAEGERQVYRYIVCFSPASSSPLPRYCPKTVLRLLGLISYSSHKALLSVTPSHLLFLLFFFQHGSIISSFSLISTSFPSLFFLIQSILISGIYLAFMKKAGRGAL